MNQKFTFLKKLEEYKKKQVEEQSKNDNIKKIEVKNKPVKFNSEATERLIDIIRHHSDESDCVEKIQQAINDGANVNAIDLFAILQTPLLIYALFAPDKNRINILKLLLENGADINSTNATGLTALMMASYITNLETVEFLVKNGADINKKTMSGNKALMTASRYGKSDIVKYLIENGAEVNFADNCDSTALMEASKAGYLDVAKILVEYGAEIEMEDIDGYTAIDLAKINGHKEIAVYLELILEQVYVDKQKEDDEYKF